jgi:hypothetical protein
MLQLSLLELLYFKCNKHIQLVFKRNKFRNITTFTKIVSDNLICILFREPNNWKKDEFQLLEETIFIEVNLKRIMWSDKYEDYVKM